MKIYFHEELVVCVNVKEQLGEGRHQFNCLPSTPGYTTGAPVEDVPCPLVTKLL